MTENSNASQHENRNFPRLETELEAIVKVNESATEAWKEIASVTTISRTGLGFTLSRPCVVGRLLTVVLPMPEEMRAYDHKAELYPVMALVQNCYLSTESDEDLYHVGAALIGKEIPESFKADPTQNFRIEGMSANGLWTVRELEHEFKARKHQRYWKQLPVTLTLLKADTRTVEKEVTFTRNIAERGASVVSRLDAQAGDKVKFSCKEFNFFSLALVRDRKELLKEGATLHLEFIDAVFPIQSVEAEFGGRVATASAGAKPTYA